MMIIASVNVNTSENSITKMILAGADMLRQNLTYYELDEITSFLEKIQRINESFNSNTKILVDLPINKFRLGDFENKIFTVQENEELIFRSASFSPDCNNFVPVNVKKLGEKLHKNETFTLANGRMATQITEVIDDETIKARILNNGIIKARQTLNANMHIDDSQMLHLYDTIIKKIAPFAPHSIAFSYHSNEFVNLFKNLEAVKEALPNTKYIVKIENELTNLELENLCHDPFISMLMIDRGEMGVNIPFEKIGIQQKNILRMAKKYNKPTVVSTQIMDSTVDNYIPTRSNISDLTNIILEGAAGVIFTKETDHNQRPAYSIAITKRIINEVEKYLNMYE